MIKKDFCTIVANVCKNIKNLTNDSWCVIGSTALVVQGLLDEVPDDIDIVVTEKDLRYICIVYKLPYPRKEFSQDNRLCSDRITIKDPSGINIDIAANLQYLTPHGNYESIDVDELRTEYVMVDDKCVWNVVTSGTYMSLAGRFNREKDRARLKALHDLMPV